MWTKEKEIIKTILTKYNIPFHFICNRVYIYFKSISGRTIEININLQKQQYSIGICPASNINVNEHKIIHEIFEQLGWL